YFPCGLLVDDKGKSHVATPWAQRREALAAFVRWAKAPAGFQLSPATDSLRVAKGWFEKMAGELDGIIAKQRSAPYESGLRSGVVQKIKNMRSADCVVGGFRYAEKRQAGRKVVGSLLL